MGILLIEHRARLRDLLCEAIRDEGWKIDAFETAQEGRLAQFGGDYDLLLLDLGLPDEDDVDVLKSLRASGTQTPVVVLTARNAINERIIGLDAGADDYLAKPPYQGELLPIYLIERDFAAGT
ncbi:response regulator transcription factor [Rhizobium laguerreae]|nr:response regulator transcription factor [Rhizobium laguerreae]